jgi:hypothetical protein
VVCSEVQGGLFGGGPRVRAYSSRSIAPVKAKPDRCVPRCSYMWTRRRTFAWRRWLFRRSVPQMLRKEVAGTGRVGTGCFLAEFTCWQV